MVRLAKSIVIGVALTVVVSATYPPAGDVLMAYALY